MLIFSHYHYHYYYYYYYYYFILLIWMMILFLFLASLLSFVNINISLLNQEERTAWLQSQITSHPIPNRKIRKKVSIRSCYH